MNASPPGATRVVVAFDPYFPDRAALLLALRLASPGSQSLHALYVEETDALTLGSFPWAREITAATAESRPLQMKAIERAYISRAAEARALRRRRSPGSPMSRSSRCGAGWRRN